MNKQIISTFIALISLLFCLPSLAVKLPTSNSATYTDYYGQVDALDPLENQLIINDISFKYGHNSQFLGDSKRILINANLSTSKVFYVKYHIKPTGQSTYFLLDLQLISKEEFNLIEARRYDD